MLHCHTVRYLSHNKVYSSSKSPEPALHCDAALVQRLGGPLGDGTRAELHGNDDVICEVNHLFKLAQRNPYLLLNIPSASIPF